MRNAWCSFTYNKVSGTYAGQSNNASAMRWKLENLRLLLDQGAGARVFDVLRPPRANCCRGACGLRHRHDEPGVEA